jgi:hypothetical protein
MMPRKAARRRRIERWLRAAAFVVFMTAGGFFILAPPMSSSDFFNSSIPAIAWGAVFFIGGALALRGILAKTPHLEQLGVSLVVIAGIVLTINQSALMFEEPITWTRGGGTAAYAAFTLLAGSLIPGIRDRVEVVSLAADISKERTDGL